jgi:hypothetical protein
MQDTVASQYVLKITVFTEYCTGDIFVVHISGSYGTVVVKINIWLPNLIEIEHEYTV